MSIRLNGSLLRTLIENAGGIDAFLEGWTMFGMNGDDSVDKATVYRWRQGQLPKNDRLLLRLAANLNVDPFAILTIPENTIAKTIDDMLDFVQFGRSMPAPLKLARSFFGRQKEWPPECVARDHFKRSWCVHEFSHDPAIRANFYETVLLTGTDPAMEIRPQVFHFAFRNPRRFGDRWLQYGFVIRHGSGAGLWHINGHNEQLQFASALEPTRVETWFGPGPVVFRVASLHGFTLGTPSEKPAAGPALQFPA